MKQVVKFFILVDPCERVGMGHPDDLQKPLGILFRPSAEQMRLTHIVEDHLVYPLI